MVSFYISLFSLNIFNVYLIVSQSLDSANCISMVCLKYFFIYCILYKLTVKLIDLICFRLELFSFFVVFVFWFCFIGGVFFHHEKNNVLESFFLWLSLEVTKWWYSSIIPFSFIFWNTEKIPLINYLVILQYNLDREDGKDWLCPFIYQVSK